MNTASSTEYLAELADNHYFVLGAYFFAFFPWTLTSNIDFISEKWRTIRRTRKLAYIHLLSSIVPVLYVGVYAEAQRRDNDSKEYGAALAALGFNLMHLMRTLMGMIQLDAFLAWCKHTMECIRTLRGDEGQFGGPDNNDVEGNVKVNNTVVDNELGGTDLSVWPSWKKIWKKVKEGEFRPSAWLITDQARLCTVRWSGAVLCGMGRDLSIPHTDKDALNLFLSRDFQDLREALENVTWDIGEKNGEYKLLSIEGLDWQLGKVGFSGEMSTAYGTEIHRYYPSRTFNSYAFEFDSLTSSYPSSNSDFGSDSREIIKVEYVNSVVVAKHLGVEKLRRIRRIYDRCRIPTNDLRLKSIKFLLEQSRTLELDDSKIFDMFTVEQKIPIFPYRMQMVALWDESTNWRILQASAHQDIHNSLLVGEALPNSLQLCQVQPRPENLFEYCAEIMKERATGNQHRRPFFLGAVMETVRTFLAVWLSDGAREPDWEPAIPDDRFEFVVGLDLPDDHFEYEYSVIWACQYALQKEVARTSSLQGNLPSSNALIMLFLLGFPLIQLENVYPIESDEPSARQDASASLPNMDNSVNVSVLVWRVSTNLAPQDVSIVIHYNLETRRMSMSLRNNSDRAQFIWQDWVDAAMGYFRGYEEGFDVESNNKRTIVRANLREPMVELCPLHASNEGGVEKTNTVRIWMGWLPFDVHVCKFEVEELLAARNIYLSERFSFLDGIVADEQVEFAERLIQAVVSGSTTEK